MGDKIQRPAISIEALRRESRPPRRGCLGWIVLGLVPIAICLASGYTVSALELAAARRTCASVSPGMARSDVESLLHRDAGATLLGWGGPSGAPIGSIELGVRGGALSWSCHVDLDAAGIATGSHFSRWIAADFHGEWDDPILAWLESLLPG
jgi:hypothetical protein